MKRSTWILLGLVVALAAVILLWERKQPSTDEAAQNKLKLVDFTADKVTSLARTGKDPLVLVKEGQDAWKLTAPVQDAADKYGVQGFLERLVQLRALRWADAGAGAKDLGLDPPQAVWKLEGATPLALEVGQKAPLGEGLYVKVGGRTALVSSDMEGLLLRPAAEFRSMNLTSAATQEIQACSVTQGGKEILAFRRDPAGGWDLTAPVRDWGSGSKLENLLDDVSLCLVDSFADDHPKELKTYGLDPPATAVRLDLSKGPAVEIRLGSPVPGSDASKGLVYASVSGRPSVMTVSLNSLKSLFQDPEGLRSLDLIRHDYYDVQEIRAAGEVALDLQRGKDGAWTFAGGKKPAGKGDAPTLVGDLQSLRGDKIVPAPAGQGQAAGNPLLAVTLKGKGFEEKVDFLRAADGAVLARTEGRGALLSIPKDGWARFEAALKVAASPGKP